MITNWAKCLSGSPSSEPGILSQFLWFNLNITIDNKSIFVVQVFHEMARLNHGIILHQNTNLKAS